MSAGTEVRLAAEEMYERWRAGWAGLRGADALDAGDPTTHEVWMAAWDSCVITIIKALQEEERNHHKLQ